MKHFLKLTILLMWMGGAAFAQKKKNNTEPSGEKTALLNPEVLEGLKFRNIGPAFTSGRIADFAVRAEKPSEYYVAVASGGVWKTVNSGTTWQPVFDSQGSYSIGCVTLDPNNHHVIWAGTGENNNQRSVAYGDGVYKSVDDGKSWENMGLKSSEHISKIIVDPNNSNTVYVAAYGPLWSAGGDRGVYKSTDGGKTWKAVLQISEHTGIADLVMDPRDPEVLYAAAHQRRRHVFTYISGGPESAIYKSVDGGETWTKQSKGLPADADLGRIGLAISPVNPDYVFAIVEAADDKGGFFRSVNRGESWEKLSDYTSSGNYYVEIFCDPVNINRVYSMDTWFHISDDGGKTFKQLNEKWKHVDNHAFWVDPQNTDYYLAGCDGGIYESYDAGDNWHFKSNLPVAQFYKVSTDNAEPFYNVFGGTQDNYSMGGPSRTINSNGIVNADWFVTLGGDGFETQVDPTDPNVIYSQYQYGNLHRYDKASGEIIDIKPMERKDDEPYRWNWDAPLLISPHAHTRLYFAANRLFKSDDRGNSWEVISPDLTRQIDRDKLPVMGKVWGVDAVAKNQSTTIYGNIVALTESPKKEGLLYVGTDDGLVQVSEDDGQSWRKQSNFPGVPDMTYVNMLLASQHDENIIYGAFNNHKNGDFKPYLLKSNDKGKTWGSIASNLPERGSVYSIAEDHVNANLLFAGTEFGVFFTVDGGKTWTQLKGGLPTIAIRDMEIQKRENDLVLASFGRGFYILDDYSPLRKISETSLEKEAEIYPVKDSWMFIEATPLGLRGKAFMGESYYSADNPPVGAVFTFYIKDEIKTLKEQRKEREKEMEKKGEQPPYPTLEELRKEDDEEKPYLLFTVKDEKGAVVNRVRQDPKKGVNRVAWNFRYPSVSPAVLKKSEASIFGSEDQGPLALPGKYTVSLSKVVDGEITELAGPEPFECKALGLASLPASDKATVLAFQNEISDLRRVVLGTNNYVRELSAKLDLMDVAAKGSTVVQESILTDIRKVKMAIAEINRSLRGDGSLASRSYPTSPSVIDRIESVVYGLWESSSTPTETMRQSLKIAEDQFGELYDRIKNISETDIAALEAKLEEAGAPYTPGRLQERR
jgi:photosystem II stability/assembly factor-like uncharacterized protein